MTQLLKIAFCTSSSSYDLISLLTLSIFSSRFDDIANNCSSCISDNRAYNVNVLSFSSFLFPSEYSLDILDASNFIISHFFLCLDN